MTRGQFSLGQLQIQDGKEFLASTHWVASLPQPLPPLQKTNSLQIGENKASIGWNMCSVQSIISRC